MNVGVTDTEKIIEALDMDKIARNHIGEEIKEISETF